MISTAVDLRAQRQKQDLDFAGSRGSLSCAAQAVQGLASPTLVMNEAMMPT
jgi:hypothetical protein